MSEEESTAIPDQLLLAQSGWVRALARRLVRDAQQAEDAVQETFLAAVRRPPRDSGDPRVVRAWLARVLRRTAAHGARRERLHQERESRVAREDGLAIDDGSVRLASASSSVVEEVLTLPEPYRATVILRYYEGISSADIARKSGASPDAVRQRLSRAHEMLRRALDRRSGDRRTWCLALAGWLGEPAPGVSSALSLTSLASASALVAVLGLAVGLFVAGGESVDGELSLAQGPAPGGAGTADPDAVPQGIASEPAGDAARRPVDPDPPAVRPAAPPRHRRHRHRARHRRPHGARG